MATRNSILISSYGYTTSMNKFSQLLRKIFSSSKGAAAPKELARCEFCGQPGHKTEDCPNSAKFHVFSVDHDAEDEGEGQ
jgi:hypothetical protein